MLVQGVECGDLRWPQLVHAQMLCRQLAQTGRIVQIAPFRIQDMDIILGAGDGAVDGCKAGFQILDHMLDQIARHGLIDMDIVAHGDLQIDAHHTVEDVGITLGQAVAKAIGDKKGLVRYGHAYVPLDEALSRVVVDFSGRPGLHYNVTFPRAMIGSFDVDLLREFFQGFVNHAGVTLHIDNLKGVNAHHVAETIFKATGRALRMAISADERMAGIMPSTKGSL